MTEPRTQHDYGEREVAAARRVLIDPGQVLGSYVRESVVVVGGWVPDLLIVGAEEPHIGSIDVDLALNVEKLREGRYAKIVAAMLATGRYEDFRALDADGCAAAFRHPTRVEVDGPMLSGALNHVTVLVASIEDFLVMKAYALAGRDKPKDAYDICYCLDNVPGGIDAMARAWREWREDEIIVGAIARLRDKFSSVDSYGPMQVAAFYDASSTEERQMRARLAYELVIRFLELVES